MKRDSVGPIPSDDKQALQVIVPVDAGEAAGTPSARPSTRCANRRERTPAGLSMHITGPVGYAADSSEAFSGIDGKLLYSAMAVVIVILLITYRSPVLWIVPVVSAGTALFVAQGVIYFLADGDTLTVNAQSSGILTVIVFGAGTDYALLLVARYREELRRHDDRHEAMAVALHRAGPAIVASGATVIAGMLCLLFATMSSTKGLGPVAAIGIAVGLLVMLTLLPALLVVLGRWVFWPVRPTVGSVDHTRDGVWARIGARIARAPRRTWVVTSLLLVDRLARRPPAQRDRPQNKDSYYTTPPSVIGEQIVAKHFPAGAGSPVLVLANAAAAAEVTSPLEAVDGVDTVADPVTETADRSSRPRSPPLRTPTPRPRPSTGSGRHRGRARARTPSPAVTPRPASTRSARAPTTTCGSSPSSSVSSSSSSCCCCAPSPRRSCSSARSCCPSEPPWACPR